jgi:hypothetical protein
MIAEQRRLTLDFSSLRMIPSARRMIWNSGVLVPGSSTVLIKYRGTGWVRLPAVLVNLFQ